MFYPATGLAITSASAPPCSLGGADSLRISQGDRHQARVIALRTPLNLGSPKTAKHTQLTPSRPPSGTDPCAASLPPTPTCAMRADTLPRHRDSSGDARCSCFALQVAILKQWVQTNEAVCYGQCWVFAGITTSLLRCIGLGARQVTLALLPMTVQPDMACGSHRAGRRDPYACRSRTSARPMTRTTIG